MELGYENKNIDNLNLNRIELSTCIILLNIINFTIN